MNDQKNKILTPDEIAEKVNKGIKKSLNVLAREIDRISSLEEEFLTPEDASKLVELQTKYIELYEKLNSEVDKKTKKEKEKAEKKG